MSARFDCADPAQLLQGLAEAEAALRRGELVVIPTDTVYGIAAEAFDPVAVDGLLKAKGRGRDMPPPVLVGTVRAAMALVMELGDAGKDLIDEFWPGALTIVCMSSPTLVWDLGEAKGTVAVRMPLHQVALDLLKRTGPLAVSSANVSGRPPATTADEAMAQLGDSVAVYLDGGPCAADVPSTIIDLTGSVPRLLRRGVIPVERLREVIPLALEEEEAPGDEAPADEAPADEVAQGEAVQDEVLQGEAVQDAEEAAPQGPAGPVHEDTGRPREVFHGPEEAAEQGNHAHRDAAG
ncbi:MAG: L-threonylcarbamoyladenylate synthase [Streptosporangiaceae bacterium]|jgi:tRNA threonylcarbamoyl adenosine modification protein (Sua5/YciO/YrdC/YwlC family)|nr:L-threonylcarbamoyladenylate synthase [Streptosporangiaceae bacterium]